MFQFYDVSLLYLVSCLLIGTDSLPLIQFQPASSGFLLSSRSSDVTDRKRSRREDFSYNQEMRSELPEHFSQVFIFLLFMLAQEKYFRGKIFCLDFRKCWMILGVDKNKMKHLSDSGCCCTNWRNSCDRESSL